MGVKGAFATFRTKVERKVSNKVRDVELRQLLALRSAYSGESGPEILIFGDSAMFWTMPTDEDPRHLAQMMRDGLPGSPRFQALVGPGYNARIVSAFLDVLPQLRSRPKVIIVPTSVLMAQRLWAEHPHYGYELEAAALREVIASKKFRERRLPRQTDEYIEKYDRLPAFSLFGARRTAGEIRLIINARPVTKWQTVVRLRHLMDFYNAEPLKPETPGVGLVRELGAKLRDLDIPSLSYIAPVNHQMLRTFFGDPAVEQLRQNSEVLEKTFREAVGGKGRVLNCAIDFQSGEFNDPVHLNTAGRLHLAKLLIEEVAPILNTEVGKA